MADVIGIAVSQLEEISHECFLARLELKTQVESEILYKIKAKIDGEFSTNCLGDGSSRCQVTGTYFLPMLFCTYVCISCVSVNYLSLYKNFTQPQILKTEKVYTFQ